MSKRLFLFFLGLALFVSFTTGQVAEAAIERKKTEPVKGAIVREALMLEANVRQGTVAIAGRVLLQPDTGLWTIVAEKPNVGRAPGLRLEARASMLESDVVEVETRIVGVSDESAKMIVRFGEPAQLNVAQMEGAMPNQKRPDTQLGVKVLKVRY